MITYIKLGKVRGLSIELKNDFGLKPFFRKNTFHHETIVDIPYVQITYTSGKWFPVKRKLIRSASNGNEETNKITKHSGNSHGH